MKIFVTGANGTIGSSFIFGIDPAKYDIMALAKDSSDDYRLQGIEGIRIVYGDICEPSAWGEQLSGVDVVVHLAALVHLPKAKREDYLKVNYEATKKIYELSKRYEVKHFIFASTTKVYGLSKDHIEFDEEYPINFESFYSESKYYAEKYLMENHKEAINYTILRIATVYGPDDKGNINKLFSMAKKGIYISFGRF